MTCSGVRRALIIVLVATAGCEDPGIQPLDAGVESDCTNGHDDDGDGRIDCLDPDCVGSTACLHFSGPARPWSPLESRGLDLLLVMDNSPFFFEANYHALVAQVRDLVIRLRFVDSGPLDLHLGVTSTDLGTGLYPIFNCEEAGGDAGRLLRYGCSQPIDWQNYLIDVAPASCDATRDGQGRCSDHTCTQASCDALGYWEAAPLVFDDQGCPRCRNYSGVALEDEFACLASLGNVGCGFEQPLEAMLQALDGNPANAGFLREDARLAVLLVTNEDDCSASDPQLFDSTQTTMDAPLGPLTSFRCFEFGITCDVNDRAATGWRTGCRPRDDAEARLHPVDRYVSFLRGLRDPSQLWVGVVAGPADGTVLVERDAYDHPEVQPVCTTADASATPALRLQAFADAFRAAEPPLGTSQSICEDHFARVIDDLVARCAERPAACFPGPVAGCTDPAASAGLPGDGVTCNDACVARCEVTETLTYDRDDFPPVVVHRVVPPCLEICPDGPCLGNADPALAYQGGQPAAIDPGLAVPACWYVVHQPSCATSRGAALVISHQFTSEDPLGHKAEPDVVFEAYCFAVPDPSDPGCP